MGTTIKAVTGNGTWTSPSNDILYKAEITLSDDRVGNVMMKTVDRWKVDDEVQIDSEKETQFGVNWKLSKPGFMMNNVGGASQGFSNDKDKQTRIGVQWAIGQAIGVQDIPTQGGLDYVQVFSDAERLCLLRDELVNKLS